MILTLIPQAFLETLYMVFFSTIFAILLGGPIGFFLFKSRGSLLYKLLSFIVNIGRSFPFAILMIALIPFTRLLVGTSLGMTAAIVPLSLAATPFFARLVEGSFKEISPKLIEAVSLMGASSFDILRKVLIPESLPSQIRGLTLMIINLIGYSAMAGLIGGGGLGQIALQYGYQRFNTPVLIACILSLFLLVEIVQRAGNAFIRYITHLRGEHE